MDELVGRVMALVILCFFLVFIAGLLLVGAVVWVIWQLFRSNQANRAAQQEAKQAKRGMFNTPASNSIVDWYENLAWRVEDLTGWNVTTSESGIRSFAVVICLVPALLIGFPLGAAFPPLALVIIGFAVVAGLGVGNRLLQPAGDLFSWGQGSVTRGGRGRSEGLDLGDDL